MIFYLQNRLIITIAIYKNRIKQPGTTIYLSAGKEKYVKLFRLLLKKYRRKFQRGYFYNFIYGTYSKIF